MKNISGNASNWIADERVVTTTNLSAKREKNNELIKKEKDTIIDSINKLEGMLYEHYKINTDKQIGDAIILIEQSKRVLQ